MALKVGIRVVATNAWGEAEKSHRRRHIRYLRRVRLRTVHYRSVAIADFSGPEPTDEELADRKRVSDRAELLDHVDQLLRPPAWIYDEIETAIEHAIAGRLDATISTREGSYRVSELVDRWELESILEVYARHPSDPSYEPAGRPPGWPDGRFGYGEGGI